MSIHNITSGAIRTGVARDPEKADGAGRDGEDVRALSQVERVDRVEISEQGRAMAEAEGAQKTRGSQSPDRLASINDRIEDGTYNTAEMAEEVASRILASGDL